MRYELTADFQRAYDRAPEAVQRAFWKQLAFLLKNSRYPSLQSKPWPPHGPGRFQARINLQWRFYYRTEPGTYVVYWLQPHD